MESARSWLQRLDKPEYFYRPAQALKRLFWSQNRAATDIELSGPLLLDPEQPGKHPFQPSNYLATLDLERCVGRMKPRGWYCLKPPN